MKTTNKIFNAITISIIVLTSIGLFGSYLSEYLIDINWFGDSTKTIHIIGGSYERVIWGARHYWYNWGFTLLFITSIIRLIFIVDNIITNNHK